MKNFVNNWAAISLALAAVTALIVSFGDFDFTQTILLWLIVCLFLHFFEEFGFPGGFPYIGMKVLMNSREKNPARWGANNLNSLFGNWGFLFLVYVLPLFVPSVGFLTLAAILFSFLEFFMHVVLFNFKLKTFYNPGLFTAVFGLTPLAIYYLVATHGLNLYSGLDYIAALIWCAAVFAFCFRSPLYWALGRKIGYPFTKRAAFGLEMNMI